MGICLCCASVGCSRYQNGHMVAHKDNTDHSVAVSLSDLSFWCYKCDDYIASSKCKTFYLALYEAKFGELPPTNCHINDDTNCENEHPLDPADLEKFFTLPQRFNCRNELMTKYPPNILSKYTILMNERLLKEEMQKELFKGECSLSTQEKRAVACFLGMVIGDALGAPLEFLPVVYDKKFLSGFNDSAWKSLTGNSFSLKPGQWTDDASMGFCLAESLLACPEFDPIDLRIRFLNWWEFGYRNAFGYDSFNTSVGLGGSIGQSFVEFQRAGTPYTKAGDLYTSGNGSIMRLAPVPIFFHSELEKAMDIASKQSKTTHQGDEAAECCRLMTFIIITLIHAPDDMTAQERKDYFFQQVQESFKTSLYSVECLAASKDEEKHKSNEKLNLKDRKWNWKSPNFRYCESRASMQPGYIGSYCMDALSMALHCVWTTDSFENALLKVVNMRGDSDSVGSVTGQIAGTLYGVQSIPSDWIRSIQQWDNNGDAALTAIKLFRK